MRLGPRSSFSALLSPAGAHVVEYRRSGRGLQVLQYARDLSLPGDVAGAVAALGRLLEACGGRGARVALSVAGFGCRQQILALPPAPDDVLRPVVAREVRRFHPDLYVDDEEPLLDFVDVDAAGSGGAGRELLVAAAPRPLVRQVVEVLRSHQIQVEHWTILPQALQRLQESFATDMEAAALLLLVPGAPLLGFFHGGELRLFSEPLEGAQPFAPLRADPIVEQLERGALFLRQQESGARLQDLLVAEDAAGEAAALQERAGGRLDLRVTPLAPEVGSAGALAALGAALDLRGGRHLNLLPAEMRPAPAAERWTRLLAVASVTLLLAAAGWWAWSARAAEAQARARLATVEAQLRANMPTWAAVRPVVDQRRSHAARVRILEEIAGGRGALPDALWPLQAAGPGIVINSLRVTPEDGGWRVALDASARAASSARATHLVEELRREIAAEIDGGAVSLDGLSYGRVADGASAMADPDAPIALAFQMLFIVPSTKQTAP